MSARVDPDIKAQAEAVLAGIGLPPSTLINMLYHQVILHNGVPFDIKGPSRNPVSIEGRTKDEILARMWESQRQADNGDVTPIDECVADFKRRNGL